eukprot:TRINITY_DN20286_c0_g1_i1.p1 TRINITY_DN20286_c0_g1~~TRINITY_DN20286_c0_g1_i1.p1  ORF type:complete len:661 (+),score=125.62 TRINITY_DN20286_c0_g1_i1:81-2063(+)
MREVVTLQVGPYANFVGAFYWNLQDEEFADEELGQAPDRKDTRAFAASAVDPIALWSLREGQMRQTYWAPRVLIYDLQENIGPLNGKGEPVTSFTTGASSLSSVATWRGPTAIYGQPSPPSPSNLHIGGTASSLSASPPSQGARDAPLAASSPSREANSMGTGSGAHFSPEQSAGTGNAEGGQEASAALARAASRSASSEPRQWTDVLRVPLLPSSLVKMRNEQVEVGNGSSDSGAAGGMESYGAGREWLASAGGQEEASERLRKLAEECDGLQGFQCFIDSSPAFSSAACDILSVMSDDFSRVPRFVAALQPPSTQRASPVPLAHRHLSSAVSFALLAAQANLLVPLCAPRQSDVFRSSAPHAHGPSSWIPTSAACSIALDSISQPWRFLPTASFRRGSSQAAVAGPMSMLDIISCLAPTPASQIACAAANLGTPPVVAGNSQGRASSHETSRSSPAALSGMLDFSGLPSLENTSRSRATTRAAAVSLTGRGLTIRESGGLTASSPLLPLVASLEASLDVGGTASSRRNVCLYDRPLALPENFPCGNSSPFSISSSGPALHINGRELSRSIGPPSIGQGSVLASLSTGPLCGTIIRHNLRLLQTFGSKRGSLGGQMLREWGMGQEDANDLEESLQSLLRGSEGDEGEWINGEGDKDIDE